jgi:hypothetical protein
MFKIMVTIMKRHSLTTGLLRHNNAPMYINAPAQERLLIFKELYMNMLQFPADCTHQLLIPGATCGHLLMQNFNNWNAEQ